MNIAHDLQTIVHQEQTLVFPQFDSDRAWQIGTQLREMAVARGEHVHLHNLRSDYLPSTSREIGKTEKTDGH